MSRIIFFLVCLSLTVDTGLFLTPIISRMVPAVTIILFASAVAFKALISKFDSLTIGNTTVFMSAWALFIALFSLLVESNTYTTLLFLSTLIGTIALGYALRTSLIDRKTVGDGILLMSVVSMVYMLLQKAGVATTGNPFYQITGAADSPNTTAIVLTTSLPIVVERIRSLCSTTTVSKGLRKLHLAGYILLGIVTLLCVVQLECRTAYIGLAIMLLVIGIGCHSKVLAFVSRMKWVCCAIAILIASVGGTLMYNMKKDSADGRMIVYKLSAEMIADKPLGHGIGMFSRDYNLRQAEYVASGQLTDMERYNASFINMAFNDYLEMGVESGIIGMLFLVAFFVLMMATAVCNRQFTALAVISAYAVMSLFNYVFCSVQPWVLLMFYAAMVIDKDKETTVPAFRRNPSAKIGYAILVLTLALAFKSGAMTIAQMKFSALESRVKAGAIVGDSEYEELQQSISTSPDYWHRRAGHSIAMRSFDKAIDEIGQMHRYSVAPNSYYLLYKSHIATRNLDAAIEDMTMMSCFGPRMLRPKLYLMQNYAEKGDTAKAVSLAHEIIDEKLKAQQEMDVALQLKDRARQFLDEINSSPYAP